MLPQGSAYRIIVDNDDRLGADPLVLQDMDDINEDSEQEIAPSEYAQLLIGARDWSVETILGQLQNENIELFPRYQRRSAWNDVKRSRFIESVILGVPVPQVVLAEREQRGRYVVIDGKQRLLTLAGLV